jgi:DnaJ-class molecular chaperone
MGPFLQQSQGKCSSCNGQGNMIGNHNRCRNCHGNKLFNQKKKLVVNIVHGSQNGEMIKFIGEANQIVTFLTN